MKCRPLELFPALVVLCGLGPNLEGVCAAADNLDKVVALQQGQISSILERMDRSWKPCGTIDQIAAVCSLPQFPLKDYEYAMIYNGEEPQPVTCVVWNRGKKIHNRLPYLIYTDDPSKDMKWGGFAFYTGTDAADDDSCPKGSWRHRYWSLSANNQVVTEFSNGCVDKLEIYCRRR
ncbi:MAG TPA: hypothetical protein VE954_18975 [Oligoflexus sp.]|uniref:hypothetical protein n=1 Tax=Oligoflexus sp. TaxID=1971216 RepID=UPI002D424C78|nr:hypothetical protein [Oligoflexus sp.]HYX35184.1 hypothetical protein [Oligoflexus sp.]